MTKQWGQRLRYGCLAFVELGLTAYMLSRGSWEFLPLGIIVAAIMWHKMLEA
jgi:hypothetical protein